MVFSLTYKIIASICCCVFFLLHGDIATNPGTAPASKKLPIKCATINARSLKSIHKDVATNSTICNLQRFHDFVYGENLDVVCVNETWLNENISNTKILSSYYHILRKDRVSRNGGGVLIAIKSSLFNSVKEFVSSLDDIQDLEIISAIVRTASNQTILFSSCYRPPDAERTWSSKLNTFLNQVCDRFKYVVMSGDFNLHNISWDATSNASGANEVNFVDVLDDQYLTQVNTIPTRANKILDIVITTVPELVSVSEVLLPETTEIFTDHSTVLHEFSEHIKARPKVERYVYNYNAGDLEGLRRALSAVNLTSLNEHAKDIDIAWLEWKDAFLTVVSHYIPIKKIKGRNPAPWVNGTILNAIRKKDSARQKLRASPNNFRLRQQFKILRSKVKYMLRKSRETFFNDLGRDAKENPKRLWSVLKRSSKTRNIPDTISSANSINTSGGNTMQRTVADNPDSIANMFNQYFASVFSRKKANEEGVMESDEPIMTDLIFSEAEVSCVLRSLDSSKATGPDGIPARLLKETADVITPSLCESFNRSVLTGTMPEEWKVANIVPVYRKGDKEWAENYRPIPLLCITSKVLERCVLNNINFQLQNAVNTCQHGFMVGRSCVTNLIETLDYVGSCLDSGGHIDMIYIDMSKAFDKFNHRFSIQKLQKDYGFGGNLLRWFQCYPKNRKQRVTVLGATSDLLPATSGVPQGSILGPALFLLYVNNLPNNVKSSRVAMFADDTKVFKAIQSPNDALMLQEDINNLENWSSESGLQFNETKCKAKPITRKTNPIPTTYPMKNSALIPIKHERDLGVWISSDLTFNKHINEQCAQANKMLGYIRRNTRTINNVKTRKTIHLALVRSHLGYATQVWTPQSIELLLQIEKPQRRATKYILNLPFISSVSYNSRLRTLHLLPICYWHEYIDMVHFFKIVNGLTSSSFLFHAKTARRTRSSSSTKGVKYEVPQCKTTTYQRSFWIRTIRTWNALTDILDLSMKNFNSFKSVLRDHYNTALKNSCNCEDARTFKTICPRRNWARTLTISVNCCF